MRKDEIVKLAGWRCEAHRHTGLSHYQCYLRENPETIEKIGYWDIEASNLVADYGIMLSWAIKDGQSDKIITDVLTPADVKTDTEDKRIVASCVEALGKFDKIVTYYGTGYDFPFLRARAAITGVEFPGYGSLLHKDCYYIVRSKFKLSSRRLENACKQLLGSSDKTKIDAKYWRNGVRGDKESLKYILDHNIKDVTDLEKLYLYVEPFVKGSRTSI